MTRGEVEAWLENIRKKVTVCSLDSTFSDEMRACAILIAIKEHKAWAAIEAEIERVYQEEDSIDHNWAMGLKHSLKIIREHFEKIYPEKIKLYADSMVYAEEPTTGGNT